MGARSYPYCQRSLQAPDSAQFLDVSLHVGTMHGFRSSFRDWAAEKNDTPREVVEAALAHVNGDDTERAYFRSDLFDKRRELMRQWAAFVVAS